jgi:uncharacterized protein YecE (DUF72 family)
MTHNDVSIANNIHVGIAGWSYPDWEGYVYPRGTKDKLRYVAEYYDVIEINSTFYRPPEPQIATSWLNRTEDLEGFYFTAKIHQDVTHRGRIDKSVTDAFATAFEPMAEAGRLRHLLAQFRYDFADATDSRTHLSCIRDAFGHVANITLELRHSSWQSRDALDFLRTLDVSVANLDYPLAQDSFNLPTCDVGEHAYFRLHGRNAKAWFSKTGRDETYNYLYDKRELDDIVARALRIGQLSKSLTLIANNHYRGKEAANALEIKAMLEAERVDVPPPLLSRYPHLETIAKPAEGMLF